MHSLIKTSVLTYLFHIATIVALFIVFAALMPSLQNIIQVSNQVFADNAGALAEVQDQTPVGLAAAVSSYESLKPFYWQILGYFSILFVVFAVSYSLASYKLLKAKRYVPIHALYFAIMLALLYVLNYLVALRALFTIPLLYDIVVTTLAIVAFIVLTYFYTKYLGAKNIRYTILAMLIMVLSPLVFFAFSYVGILLWPAILTLAQVLIHKSIAEPLPKKRGRSKKLPA